MKKEEIDGHWEYTYQVIMFCVRLMEFLYKRALEHGYKYGYADGRKHP